MGFAVFCVVNTEHKLTCRIHLTMHIIVLSFSNSQAPCFKRIKCVELTKVCDPV